MGRRCLCSSIWPSGRDCSTPPKCCAASTFWVGTQPDPNLNLSRRAHQMRPIGLQCEASGHGQGSALTGTEYPTRGCRRAPIHSRCFSSLESAGGARGGAACPVPLGESPPAGRRVRLTLGGDVGARAELGVQMRKPRVPTKADRQAGGGTDAAGAVYGAPGGRPEGLTRGQPSELTSEAPVWAYVHIL